MQTKITIWSIAFMMSLTAVYSQTHVYNETTSSGMWIQGADVKEEYSNRDAFSFEDPTIVNQVWAKWENDGAADMKVIDTDGANGTSNSLEVSFTTAGEVQIFTNQSTLDVNASIDKTKTYVLSFWAKASETTTITAALENPEPWVSFLWQDQEIGTDWVKYSFDIDPSTKDYTGSADNVYVKVKMVPENSSIKVWFDEFSLKQIGFDGEVVNPVSDAVNSSDKCAMSSTDGTWRQIQYFPTYTPVSGDKLFFSVYNPNNAGPGQIQFEYSTEVGTWHSGGDVAYNSGSVTGWVEYSIDLASHVGNEINKIIMMPAGDNSAAVYIDNIYFGQSSILTTTNPIVYDETTSSGMWFQGTDGAEVSNPVSDGVNSSANCAMSATDGNWQQIQYFPTYTPVSGDKLFFSVYNPNNAGPGQIKFEYSTEVGTWQSGGDVAYNSGSVTGWIEYSVDLTAHVGNEIFKVIIMPAGDNSSAVYIDNIYFGQSSILPTPINPIVYDETISSGMWFQGTNGAEVANPVSDGVNSSANCAMSATDGNWQQIQYFPTYTPVSGDKLFFSVYNPNNAGPGQLQFEYSTEVGTWHSGGDVAYNSGSVTGWIEYSVDLTAHVGKEIFKVIIMPAGDNSSAVYIDNIYFANSTTTLNINTLDAKKESNAFITSEGKIKFIKDQSNTKITVCDLMGRLVLNEIINGKESVNSLNTKGVYILRIESNGGVSSQKVAY